MTVLLVVNFAVLLLVGLAYNVWCEVRWDRERTRLTNLATSKTPHEYAVLQRASTPPAKPAAEDAEPPVQYVGLS